MKIVVALVALLAGAALGGSYIHPTKPTDDTLSKVEGVHNQRLVFQIYRLVYELPYVDDKLQEIVKDFKLNEHFDHFENVDAVKKFWNLYKSENYNQVIPFSIFDNHMRKHAIALFEVFYYAKDFDTFYKSAIWALNHVNREMFVYSFTLAVNMRPDTKYMLVPQSYEITPHLFVPVEAIKKAQHLKLLGDTGDANAALNYGIFKQGEDSTYIVANYTGWFTHLNEEQKLSYFTEDIRLNGFYYQMRMHTPFWLKDDAFGVDHHRRGELYFYIHQQLLARYYLERQVNHLGDVPRFSWRHPIETGYYPSLESPTAGVPLISRDNYLDLSKTGNTFDLEYVQFWEKTFLRMIESRYAFDYEGNFVNLDSDLSHGLDFFYKYLQHGCHRSLKFYEISARHLLGDHKKHGNYITPSALDYYESSLRDPVYWQLYSRILYYITKYRNDFAPYTQSELVFPGVKIEHVEVDKLVTYFKYHNTLLTNSLWLPSSEVHLYMKQFYARQEVLSHKPFNVKFEITSDKEVTATVKIFMGPKYDSHGYDMTFDDNKYNFVELDWFPYKLSVGKNSIVRNSDEFMRFSHEQPDSLELFKEMYAVENRTGKFDYSPFRYRGLPQGLMLPKGSKSGFPVQFFFVVYPYHVDPSVADKALYKAFIIDSKPLGYPFDRKIDDSYFFQPNMYRSDALVYHHGDEYVHNYGKPAYFMDKSYEENVVQP